MFSILSLILQHQHKILHQSMKFSKGQESFRELSKMNSLTQKLEEANRKKILKDSMHFSSTIINNRSSEFSKESIARLNKLGFLINGGSGA